jgi:hypothetical protein
LTAATPASRSTHAHDRAVALERAPRARDVRDRGDPLAHQALDRVGQGLGRRDQHHRLVAAAVLGLREEVGGDVARVRALVGEDHDLARAGVGVGLDRPAHDPLRGRDVGVARADDLGHVGMLAVPYASAAIACAPPTR